MTDRLPGIAVLVSLLICLTPLHAQTQANINAQAHREFERSDTELNKTYEALLNKLPDVHSKQDLRASQRAWLVFRDAEGAFVADQVRDGSMAPTVRYEAMTQLTQQRIKELKLHFEK
jgi:uncharacterized protein YecT (DUF1311 family)